MSPKLDIQQIAYREKLSFTIKRTRACVGLGRRNLQLVGKRSCMYSNEQKTKLGLEEQMVTSIVSVCVF